MCEFMRDFEYAKVCYSMLKFLYVSSQGEEEDEEISSCQQRLW